MVELRDYQIDAVNAVSEAWQKGFCRVVLEVGMGAGKSFICAEICRRALDSYPKILVLCHQAEILSQNAKALDALSGGTITHSIYCDSLGSKDDSGQVVFASVDSYVTNPNIAKTGLVIVDEAHRVPTDPLSRYQTIFRDCEATFLVGLTATPFRLDGGLIYGKNRPFEIRAYNLGVGPLIKMGYLTPFQIVELDPVVVAGEDKIDYKALGALAAQEQQIKHVSELIQLHMFDRKCTIIYCCSREHAKRVAENVSQCAYIDGQTPLRQRLAILDKLREGTIKFITNVEVLTTGIDIPICDGIVFLRPTLSASLYVQAIGRSLRLHPDKKKAKILELTDNLCRFGEVTDPMVYSNPASGTEDRINDDEPKEAPKKKCPECKYDIAAPCRVCPICDYLFIKEKEDTQATHEFEVLSYNGRWVQTLAGPMAIVVEWQTPKCVIQEYLNVNNQNRWVAQQAKTKLRYIKAGKVKRIKAKRTPRGYWQVMTYHTT